MGDGVKTATPPPQRKFFDKRGKIIKTLMAILSWKPRPL
jgi:hypothetical protein